MKLVGVLDRGGGLGSWGLSAPPSQHTSWRMTEPNCLLCSCASGPGGSLGRSQNHVGGCPSKLPHMTKSGSSQLLQHSSLQLPLRRTGRSWRRHKMELSVNHQRWQDNAVLSRGYKRTTVKFFIILCNLFEQYSLQLHLLLSFHLLTTDLASQKESFFEAQQSLSKEVQKVNKNSLTGVF